MIAAPALSIPMFGTAGLYAQIVMKTDLGYTAANKPEAAAFAAKVDAANKRAVAACDKAGLGFLLNPFQCGYDPARDAAALCAGVAGNGVTGGNADPATCMSMKEAIALDKIWFGAHCRWQLRRRANSDSRTGKSLGAGQLWWTFTRARQSVP